MRTSKSLSRNTGISEISLAVPNSEALPMSSVVLADSIERVPARSAGSGQFVIGDYKVRPRVDGVFHRDEKMGVFFKLSRTTPNNQVYFELVRKGTNDRVMQRSREAQPTMHETFDLSTVEPGQYVLHVKAGDDGARSVAFEVR